MTPSQTASPASPPGNSLFPGSLPPSFKSCLSLCVWFTDLIRIVAPFWVGGYLTRHRECFSDYNTSVTPSDILENTDRRITLTAFWLLLLKAKLQVLHSWWEWVCSTQVTPGFKVTAAWQLLVEKLQFALCTWWTQIGKHTVLCTSFPAKFSTY